MMKDRGDKKWTSLMLPEHKKLLKKFYKEQEYVLMPEIADDKCEEINNILVEALREEKEVALQINEDFSVQEILGIITDFSYKERMLKLRNYHQKSVFVKIDKIIDVKLI